MHDPLSSFDLVSDELDQRTETGYDVTAQRAAFAATDPDDVAALEGILESLEHAERAPGWAYEEPESLGDILDSLPVADSPGRPGDAEVERRIHGAWLGRIAGCNLGKPVEWGPHWTTTHLREYLELADAWPLRDYFPVLDPMPARFELRENWPETTRGNVDGSARDDDIDYPILGLHLLEQHGAGLTRNHVAESWLTLLPYLQVYTAERAAYTNLINNVPIERVATVRNPYREWIGALIRGDVFGWTNPGDPRAAAALAYEDASLSHVANGVYGEIWAAAITSCAFGAATVEEAFEASLDHVPPRSRLAEALRDVQRMHRDGLTWEQAIEAIQLRYGRYSWVHTINNAAIIAAGLLWGEGDYAATVGLTVQGGWDTDSNGATAGSVAGIVLGADRLPANFIEPLHDRTRSALFGFDHSRISDLARRTAVLARAGAAVG
ncbi:ADP-ribosylglycohydrolase family protein [Agromyces protaetiae]|uniref:ADP-ribosylglycohydrolase family protein n=1 Tax=Agromyces protaetiae TaxID=2509455 RepID=UPI001AA02355|nr:ADP-ribosylglycohydrolase family protein [Agromyces protaetiae]